MHYKKFNPQHYKKFTPIIPAMLEADIRESWSEAYPDKKYKTLSQKQTKKQRDGGHDSSNRVRA
jgi:hypothetical protein